MVHHAHDAAAQTARSTPGPFTPMRAAPRFGILLAQVTNFVRFNHRCRRAWRIRHHESGPAMVAALRVRAHYPLAIKGGLDPQIRSTSAPATGPQGMKADEATSRLLHGDSTATRTSATRTFKAAVANSASAAS